MTELTARLGGPEAITAGILEEFRGMCAVPHPSHGEQAERELLSRRLETLGGTPAADAAGNLTADLPAAPGCEGAPLTILQGHMDMVCAVRPGSGYVPERDPIRPVAADGFLRSDGRSSLGADNGLGNAAVLWLLGQKLSRGPVRVIFTVAEEVGLAGAREVDPAWLAGAKYLLNTDGFHLGTAVVGSAGGRRETFSRPLATCPAAAGQAFTVSLSGFSGGHSGDDIHRGRGNPVKALTTLLAGLPFPWQLADFSGGQTHNAIPTWASATVVADRARCLDLRAAFARWAAELETAHRDSDPDFRAELKEVPTPEAVWDDGCLAALLALTGGTVLRRKAVARRLPRGGVRVGQPGPGVDGERRGQGGGVPPLRRPGGRGGYGRRSPPSGGGQRLCRGRHRLSRLAGHSGQPVGSAAGPGVPPRDGAEHDHLRRPRGAGALFVPREGP